MSKFIKQLSLLFKNASFLKYTKKIKIWSSEISNESFVLFVNLIFYFGLLFLNPNNKIIVVSFVLLFIAYNSRFKNFKLSLILCYLSSLIIPSGKTYEIELIPKEVFMNALNEDGYKISFILNSSLIASIVMIITIIYDFITQKELWKTVSHKKEFFLFLYFMIVMITDTFVSKMPDISWLIGFSGLSVLFAYLFIKFYKPSIKIFIPLIIALFASQILFESSIALRQFSVSSTLGKNVESNATFQSNSNAPDELNGRFRPVGTMSHSNNFAAWMVFFLIIIFAYNYQKEKTVYFLVSFFGLVVLVLTLSRAAWIAYFLSIIFCLFFFEKVKKQKLPLFLQNISLGSALFGYILILVLVFPRLEKSLYISKGGIEFRENQLRSSIDVVKKNILFGVGSAMSLPTIISESSSRYFRDVPMPVHNWYVVTLIEHGLFSLVSLLLFFVLIIRTEINNLYYKSKLEMVDTFRFGYVLGLISLLIISFFQPFFLLDIVILTFAIMTYR